MTGAVAAVHPQVAALLELRARWPDARQVPLDVARRHDVERARRFAGPPPSVGQVSDARIPVAGGAIDARVYHPAGSTHPAGAIVWMHGGGWVFGSIAGADVISRALARATGCAVISVGYRRAPEHPFPGPLLDCYAALTWVHDHRHALGIPAGPIVVGGDSAGGNLATAVCLLARDRGGPAIALQVLAYPATCRDLEASSRVRYAEGFGLTEAMRRWFWQQYLVTPEDGSDPRASPLLAASLEGLPAAHLVVAEHDVLHDEAMQYAERLAADGVPTTVRRFGGMIHGFMTATGMIDDAWAAIDDVARAVRRALQRACPGRFSLAVQPGPPSSRSPGRLAAGAGS